MSNLKLNYKIDAPTFKQATHIIKPDFVIFERQQSFSDKNNIIDTFGASWLFLLVEVKTNKIGVKHKGQILEIPFNNIACFLPPYSIVEWCIPKGVYNWFGYMSETQLPVNANIPNTPICFYFNSDSDTKPDSKPTTIAEILELIKTNQSYFKIGKEDKASAIAQKTKSYIDQNFRETLLISDVAVKLNTNRAYLSREFKAVFGLSPIEYRSRLRVFESLTLLRRGQNVASAGLDCGFENLTQYQSQFKKIISVSPLEFCINKKTPSLTK